MTAVVIIGLVVTFGAALRIGLRRSLLGVLIATLTAVRFESIPIDLAVVRYAAVVALIAATWHPGTTSPRRVSDLPDAARWVVRGLWLLLILAVASNAWSISPPDTIPQTAALAGLVLLIHLSVTRHWSTPDSIAGDMAVVFWTLVASVAVGLVVHPPTEIGRVYGLYKNPNGLAMSCTLAAAIGIGLYLHRRRFMYLPPLALLVITLLLTQSRTSIVALVAAGMFVLVRRGASTVLSVIASAIVLALAVFAFQPPMQSLPGPMASVADRFTDSGNAGLLSNRDAIWQYAYLLWQRQPLTGYGFRSGEVIFDAGRDATAVDNTVAHSSYIQMLVELGLIGLIPSAVLMYASYLVLRRCKDRGLGAGLASCAVVGLAVGGGESAVFGVGQSFSWALWLAIAAAACLSSDKAQSSAVPSTRRPSSARSSVLSTRA